MQPNMSTAGADNDLVRMIEELKRELAEGHRREAATAEILSVMSRSRIEVQPVFDTIVKSAVRLCEGLFSGVYQFDGELLHHVAHYNYAPDALKEVQRKFPTRPTREFGTGRAILEGAVVHIPDVEVDPEYRNQPLSRAVGMRSGLFVPMLRDGAPVGVILVARAEPGAFSDSQINMLKSFADQAVIAIENARLFEAEQASKNDLQESLDYQTATSEVLNVISRSPTDVQPVFDVIARSAARLCKARYCNVFRFDGQSLYFAAAHGTSVETQAELRRRSPLPPSRGFAAGRPFLPTRLRKFAISNWTQIIRSVTLPAPAALWACRCRRMAGRSEPLLSAESKAATFLSGKSSCSRPSPNKPSSPSRTRDCLRPSRCARASPPRRPSSK